jgi:hypothetical protein
MGKEADAVKLDIYTRWESAECDEGEEEDYPCNAIGTSFPGKSSLKKTGKAPSKYFPSPPRRILQRGTQGNGQA